MIATLRSLGHDPSVVLQTSPGHLQAWIRLSTSPLEPALATAAGKLLARSYGGDGASTVSVRPTQVSFEPRPSERA